MDKQIIAAWRAAIAESGKVGSKALGEWDLKRRNDRTLKRFHVIASVEDFDTIGSSARESLTAFGEVRFSCLWTQYNILAREPLIETASISRSFHEQEFEEPYYLVIAISNVGSTAPLRAMILNTVEQRGFWNFESIVILCGASHPRARLTLRESLPDYLASQVQWGNYRRDLYNIGDAYTASLGGLSPSQMVGLQDEVSRETFTPPAISVRIQNLPRRPRRFDTDDSPKIRVK